MRERQRWYARAHDRRRWRRRKCEYAWKLVYIVDMPKIFKVGWDKQGGNFLSATRKRHALDMRETKCVTHRRWPTGSTGRQSAYRDVANDFGSFRPPCSSTYLAHTACKALLRLSYQRNTYSGIVCQLLILWKGGFPLERMICHKVVSPSSFTYASIYG